MALSGADPRRYVTYLRSRPPQAEEQAVAALLDAARETGCRVHVVHLSAASALPALRAARSDGIAVSVETCPHYLALAAEDVADGATDHKCAPPVRGRDNRDALWTALRAGDIDLIASDHSPCPPELKLASSGDFLRAWGGISSLQLGLAVVWTAARERGVGFADVVGWMGAAPARLVGLDRKGSLAPGNDADLVVWHPDAERVVDPARLHSRATRSRRTRAGGCAATSRRPTSAASRCTATVASPRRRRGGCCAGRRRDGRRRARRPRREARGMVLVANDEFFAPKENLLDPRPPRFDPTAYSDRGKVMDGWETRRRRTPGHDWCIVRLGVPGVVRGVVVDTSFFRGNYPDRCSLDGCYVDPRAGVAELADPGLAWVPLLAETPLRGDSVNRCAVDAATVVTHVRLGIHPDGGVARLRVHGDVVADLAATALGGGTLDLASVVNGATVTDCSDRFFGSPGNLLLVGDGKDMGDGWETQRRRGPGHDWVVVRLATQGVVERVEVDTTNFKGNYPDSCWLDSCDASGGGTGGAPEATSGTAGWRELVGRTPLGPHARHLLTASGDAPATHVRLCIAPDGGVSRLRVYGRPTAAGWDAAGIRRLDALPGPACVAELLRCCGSAEWARRMAASRPFGDAATLAERADAAWADVSDADRLEAFAAHPRIGERAASAWSQQEQAGTGGAADATRRALVEGNARYTERFGHVFLICATGKSAEQMLDALQLRMHNDPATELRVAAEEQRRITRLRLAKLLRPPDASQ